MLVLCQAYLNTLCNYLIFQFFFLPPFSCCACRQILKPNRQMVRVQKRRRYKILYLLLHRIKGCSIRSVNVFKNKMVARTRLCLRSSSVTIESSVSKDTFFHRSLRRRINFTFKMNIAAVSNKHVTCQPLPLVGQVNPRLQEGMLQQRTLKLSVNPDSWLPQFCTWYIDERSSCEICLQAVGMFLSELCNKNYNCVNPSSKPLHCTDKSALGRP